MKLTPNDIECIHAARNMILQDVHHRTIRQIAEASMLSPTKLKKGFKMIFGTGLFEYFETIRLEKSKEMMSDRNKSLKEISKAIGYKHANNYSKAFKKKYGISPRSWRRTLLTVLLVSGSDYPDFCVARGLHYPIIPISKDILIKLNQLDR
jgi:AraC-like DNA-binding protein